MKKTWKQLVAVGLLVCGMSVPAWAMDFELEGTYEMSGRYYKDADIVHAKDAASAAAKEADVDSNQYIKHVFSLNPTINVNEDIALKAEINVFDNIISGDEWQTRDHAVLDGTEEDFDSYSIFRVDYLWAEVMTDFGFFVAGVTPAFQGIGYFVELPDMDEWTFGLVWEKVDEDGYGEHNSGMTDSDDADEDAVALLANYETDTITVEGALGYGWSGSDNSESSVWVPSVKATYADDGLTAEGFFRYSNGTFATKDSKAIATLVAANPGVAPLLVNGKPAEDIEYGGWSTYAEAAYDIEAGDMTVTPVATLAYASGAEQPNEISGYFDDDQTFGAWLMNDVSDSFATAYETPASNDGNALGDPNDDDYSFSNILLLRLGATAAVTDELTVSGNLVWAQKASTEYLEKWNPALGEANIVNPDATKLATLAAPGNPLGAVLNPAGITKNKVDKDLGWELNVKADYAVQENLNFAVQASYYAPGSFYESAIEKNFGSTSTGLEVVPEMAARWIATISF